MHKDVPNDGMKKLICLSVLLLVVAGSSVLSEDIGHVVMRGETLYSIALEYGVSLAMLMQANGIDDPTKLAIGRRLVIPQVYVAAKEDTLWGIARAYSISVDELRALNGFGSAYILKAGDVVTVPRNPETSTATRNQVVATTPVVSSNDIAVELPGENDKGMQTPFDLDHPFWPHNGDRLKREGKFTGTDFVGNPGDLVYSVSNGVVVYREAHRVFINLVIIETDDDYQYVYGGTDVVSVNVNQRVTAGTEIGKLGVDPNTGESRLFFTVMKSGKIVDSELAPRG